MNYIQQYDNDDEIENDNEIEKENENGSDTTDDDDDGSMNNSHNNHDESLHNRGVENPPICAKSASP